MRIKYEGPYGELTVPGDQGRIAQRGEIVEVPDGTTLPPGWREVSSTKRTAPKEGE